MTFSRVRGVPYHSVLVEHYKTMQTAVHLMWMRWLNAASKCCEWDFFVIHSTCLWLHLQPREGEIDTLLISGDQCLECEARFPSNEAAIVHYKAQHLRFSYICDVCQLYFQRNSTLDVHYATCHARSTVASNAPSNLPTISNGQPNFKLFAAKLVARKSTTATNKPGPPPKKGRNSKKFLAKASRLEKRRIMKIFNQKHCLGCKMDFPSTPEITQHFKEEHQTDVFICTACNKAYLSAQALSLHRKQNAKVITVSIQKSYESINEWKYFHMIQRIRMSMIGLLEQKIKSKMAHQRQNTIKTISKYSAVCSVRT